MCGRMEAAEQARNALQLGLAEAERSGEALREKNTQLEAQLRKAEESGAELQAELRGIQEEKEEIQEKLSEVRRQNGYHHTKASHGLILKNENSTETVQNVKRSYFLKMTSVTSLGHIFQFFKRSCKNPSDSELPHSLQLKLDASPGSLTVPPAYANATLRTVDPAP